MRIAIIGTGISGNAAAWALATGSDHEITVYEKENRTGGHSATVKINYDGTPITVDTGFIVYNELNYPNMVQLFKYLNVPTEPSDMSFSASTQHGQNEWAGKTKDVLSGFFAKRSNLLSPRHWQLLLDMQRFNKTAIADRAEGRFESEYSAFSLQDYLDHHRFSRAFRDNYLIPMGGAIWSTPPHEMLRFPARSFVTFFDHHRLMHWDRPLWRTVSGGSRTYVDRLTHAFKSRIKLEHRVVSVSRADNLVEVLTDKGERTHYDHVIFASHTDETLAMLRDAAPQERAILSAIRYRNNDVYLHHDPRFMPQRKAAWAAWNVRVSDNMEADLCVTYWMNVLQPSIPKHLPLFVTLNPPEPIAPDMIFGRFSYAHPQFDAPAIDAQKRIYDLQGQNRTWFCGAWQGYGFHEDGLISGLSVAQNLGATLPWTLYPRDLDVKN